MPHEDRIAEEEQRAKDGYHLIRMRLERLQQNIDKPAPIPTRKDPLRKPRAPPEFVRNVVGSSAAAGSAEFHIYRNNRRKEYERLEYIDKVAKMEEGAAEFKRKRETIEADEEERTAKKRAKRLRRKEKLKALKKGKKGAKESSSSESEDDDNEADEEEKSERNEAGGSREESAETHSKDDEESKEE